MAHAVRFFMSEEDEKSFLRFLERMTFEVYPIRVPPDWKPFRVTSAVQAQLPEESMYFAASECGNVLVDKVKRGPDKGNWRVDEVRSPVVYFERSRMNDEGELLSGKLWAELDVTPETGRRNPAPDRFRRLVLEIDEWMKKTFRKGAPKIFLVGPHAARLAKEGLVLRDSDHRGGTVIPFK